MNKFQWAAMTALSGALLMVSSEADACGGCFAPATVTETSTVTGHRMAFAVSEERTVLWDQFEYTGSPEDFSWVLPIAPGANIEESTDAWFEALDAVTTTRVSNPQLQCATSSGGGCGFMGSSDEASTSGEAHFLGEDGVEVLHQGTVGPYERVTLRAASGDSLRVWLDTNGYAIPSDIDPIIDAYVSEGADFIALKLSPGQGVQQMTPVRVVTPGGDAMLPLRMVAAGTGQYVDIVLYVIGESRYAMPDLEESRIALGELTWDFADNTSNYPALRAAALEEFLGHTYITTYSHRSALADSATDQFGATIFYNTTNADPGSFGGIDNFSDLYFAQARANDGLGTSTACASVRTALGGSSLVVETTPGPGEASDAAFACDGYTDIAAAVVGMRPGNVWVTRLELSLPREALAMDCVVTPAAEQTDVSNQLQAVKAKNRPSGCPEVIFASRVARGSGSPRPLAFALIGAVLLGLVARRARRKA